MKGKITSYKDLEVYKKLCELHLEVNRLTFTFPKFELYELGSQLRETKHHTPNTYYPLPFLRNESLYHYSNIK